MSQLKEYENVHRLIELEEIKDNKIMSKTIKTKVMFDKNLTHVEPPPPEIPEQHAFLISPQRLARYHLEHGKRLKEKSE